MEASAGPPTPARGSARRRIQAESEASRRTAARATPPLELSRGEAHEDPVRSARVQALKRAHAAGTLVTGDLLRRAADGLLRTSSEGAAS